MSPLLIDYYQRFAAGVESVKFDYFFTQLSPTEAFTRLPYLFHIESFCLRLLKAALHQERICIYSDYDTDAVTAVAVAYWGLVELGFSPDKLSFYAPDRFTEGYGLNLQAVQHLAADHELIITVDCGINSTQEAAFLKNTNTDLLITDHHHLHGPLPEAVAVINPRLSEFYQSHAVETISQQQLATLSSELETEVIDFWATWSTQILATRSNKPENFLSQSVTGVGVIWFSLVWFAYFLQALKQNFTGLAWPSPNVPKLNNLLAFVAIGTMADCQSVLDPVNRLLVRSGLQVLNKSKYPFLGLQALMQHTGFQTKQQQGYRLTSQDLSFVFSPILNSSGRISHARLSIETLLANDITKADLLARELINTNENRKNLVKTIAEETQLLVSEQLAQNSPVIWLEGRWNKGVIGLLASRFVTQFNLPCVVISLQEEEAVASLRAPKGFHLVEAIKLVADRLLKFGGHPEAAGFTCKLSELPLVKDLLITQLTEQAKLKPVSKNKFAPDHWLLPSALEHLTYEPQYIWLRFQDLNSELLQQTWLLDPFGQDFPVPKFIFPVKITNPEWFGENSQHLKIRLQSDISLTWFNVNPELKFQLVSQSVWLATRLTQNPWNGQLRHDLIVDQFWLV